jgi:hypothetical protein
VAKILAKIWRFLLKIYTIKFVFKKKRKEKVFFERCLKLPRVVIITLTPNQGSLVSVVNVLGHHNRGDQIGRLGSFLKLAEESEFLGSFFSMEKVLCQFS